MARAKKTYVPPAIPDLLSREDHLPILEELLAECGVTTEICAKCKACGINTLPEELQNESLRKDIEAFRQQFFPEEP